MSYQLEVYVSPTLVHSGNSGTLLHCLFLGWTCSPQTDVFFKDHRPPRGTEVIGFPSPVTKFVRAAFSQRFDVRFVVQKHLHHFILAIESCHLKRREVKRQFILCGGKGGSCSWWSLWWFIAVLLYTAILMMSSQSSYQPIGETWTLSRWTNLWISLCFTHLDGIASLQFTETLPSLESQPCPATGVSSCYKGEGYMGWHVR